MAFSKVVIVLLISKMALLLKPDRSNCILVINIIVSVYLGFAFYKHINYIHLNIPINHLGIT